MTVLALETSCDETSAAVVRDGCILSNVVSSQIQLHREYGGVVPELATREHLRNLLPVTRAALAEAGCAPEDLDAVAATRGPGLPSALMAGLRAAQGLAFSLGKRWLGIHHHEAHLYSPWIAGEPPRLQLAGFAPHVSLIASGGHTLLVQVTEPLRHQLLGGTIDDAAGECFDKVGKLLDLAYPAGPQVEALARAGDGLAFDLPRPLLHDGSDDFSFSGLKTAARYRVRDEPAIAAEPARRRDFCASLQAAIVEVLVNKTVTAARRLHLRCVTASGGVTCNGFLRESLAAACKRDGIQLRLAAKSLCTDNAAMVGALAWLKLTCGGAPEFCDADISPAWSLAEVD